MTRIVSLLSLTAAFLPVHTAHACGGFFCQQTPVDQSGEKIVFAIDQAEGKVVTHVQIAYEGAAEEFAWVVPAPAQPELFLSTEELFTTLDMFAEPRFQVAPVYHGDCFHEFAAVDDSDAVDFDVALDSGLNEAPGGGVLVVSREDIGPYDTVVLQASSEDLLLDWLQDNGYALPDSIAPAMAPYVAQDSYFVALRLRSQDDVGTLAPLGMRYQGSKPQIPITLTSVAATPDMRLIPYVFSDGRAVPDNYMHVTPNLAAFDWLGSRDNYEDIVKRAADEAGGQAFATDFAGQTERMRGVIAREGRYQLDRLAASSDVLSFMDELLFGQGFAPTETLLQLLRTHVPMPQTLQDQGLDELSFYNCVACYLDDDLIDEMDFDAAAFTADLDTYIVTPAEEAESLFVEHSWLTRLTSSMSPEEMTTDPSFVINPTMDEVDRTHVAELHYDCKDETDATLVSRRLELADGREIILPSEAWMWDNDVTYLDYVEELASPAALEIQRMSADGPPETVVNNEEQSSDDLRDYNIRVAEMFDLDAPGGTTGPEAAGCGCRQGTPSGLIGLVPWLMFLRRRRQTVSA